MFRLNRSDWLATPGEVLAFARVSQGFEATTLRAVRAEVEAVIADMRRGKLVRDASGWLVAAPPGEPLPSPAAAPAPPARTAPAPGDVKLGPEDAQRADDLALLSALVPWLTSSVEALEEGVPPLDDPEAEQEAAEGEESERERLEGWLVAFADMLAKLRGPQLVLTLKQRAWAIQAAERLDLSWGDPGARNRNVPRGAEVTLLVSAMPRPLAPPGRKAPS